jgi:hypothetical protein
MASRAWCRQRTRVKTILTSQEYLVEVKHGQRRPRARPVQNRAVRVEGSLKADDQLY